MQIKVGTSTDSWGIGFPPRPGQVPWHRFLDEVAETGYEWTELGLYGYLPTDPHALCAELDSRGLGASAGAVLGHLEDPASWPDIEQQVLESGGLAAAVGAQYLLLIDGFYPQPAPAGLGAPERLEENAWARLIESTHKVAEIVRAEFGLRLVLHPCVGTHVEYEDQIEAFLEQTDPSRVSLCFDIGHHAYRGADPIAFMRKWCHRIPYLHLKNVDAGVLKRVNAENLPLVEAVKMGVFCEPPVGLLDFEAFRDLLREIGYQGWAVVEQDMHAPPLDKPLPIAKRTRAYLRDIGIG